MIDELLRKVRERLYPIAKHSRGGGGNKRYDTSDIVQQSLIQIWQEIRKVGAEQFICNASYLEKVGRCNAIQLWRRHTAQRRTIAVDRPFEEDCIAHSGCDPQLTMQRKELVTRTLVAASQLDDVHQKIVLCRIVDGKSIAQTAQELGLSVDVVRGQYKKALDKIRKRLSNDHCV